VFFFFLTSGLFLGWSLGANDAANIFGTAVGSRMVSFKRAAIIASIFVIIGAVVQGSGTTQTLGSLGLIDELAGSFTVALAAGITVFFMTKNGLPVSTTQAIVGAIIGWNLFANRSTDQVILFQIVSTWVSGPILGAVFSAILYLLMRCVLKRLKIHAINLDTYIRWGLIAVGAFGAYSLGANNIANVIGVFVGGAPNILLNFGLFSLDGTQLLFFLGGIAISVGIFTYSKRIINTVGNGIMSLSAEAAIVVVLAQALVLFFFSSTGFSNFIVEIGLPRIPLVPVSSSQVVVGAVLGIGLIKGVQEVRIKTLGGIAIGWLLTPLVAGFLSFFSLFFVQNVFNQKVYSENFPFSKTSESIDYSSVSRLETQEFNLIWLIIGVASIILFSSLMIFMLKQNKQKINAQKELHNKQNEFHITQKALMEADLKAIKLENTALANKLEYRRKEIVNMALNFVEQKNFMDDVIEQLTNIESTYDPKEKSLLIKELIKTIKIKMNYSDKLESFNIEVEKLHKGFTLRLEEKFPQLTENDKKLAILLRLGLSSKEIAPLLNISPKSAEINRYRLRKKLNIIKGKNLVQFIQSL
jgi:phosphate/sulfate permease/DNA-binding CsgD family transcriptional regulator